MSSSSRENNSIYRSVIENNRWAEPRAKKFVECFSFLFVCLFIGKTLHPIFSTIFPTIGIRIFIIALLGSFVALTLFFFFFNPNTYYLSKERLHSSFCISKLFIARINLLIVRAQMWHVSIATIVRVLPYSFVKKLKSPEKFSVKVLVRLESILILNKNF